MLILRGMTWDHVRGYDPVVATANQFHQLNPEIKIEWNKRSLKDFGDFPVDQLASDYDLIVIDHPHIGTSVEQGLLVPLNEVMNQEYLNNQLINSVGQSYDSYNLNGKQWALPIDTAAQVAVLRPDLIGDWSAPTTWEQVNEFADSLPYPYKIAIPLCPVDAISCAFSLIANRVNNFFDEENGAQQHVLQEAIEQLEYLLPRLHPLSLACNPIQMLDYMSGHGNEIAYVPLIFGYSNYSREGFRDKMLQFANIPSHGNIPSGSVLGGAGLVVSAYSEHMKEAIAYAEFTASEEIQKTTYFEAGGQPGHRAAWVDPRINSQCNRFFINTLDTLDHSFLRPRIKHFPTFQERAGYMLHEYLLKCCNEKGNSSSIVRKINALYKETLFLHK